MRPAAAAELRTVRIVVRVPKAHVEALDRRVTPAQSRAAIIRAAIHAIVTTPDEALEELDAALGGLLDHDQAVQRLRKVSAGLQRLRAPAPSPAPAPSSRRAQLVAAMKKAPGSVFTPRRVATLFGDPNPNAARTLLLVVAAQGHVHKVARGQYTALAEVAQVAAPAPKAPR